MLWHDFCSMNYSKYFKKYNLPWWGWIIVLIIFFGLLFGIFCLNAWLLKIIWNAVIPSIFTLTTISFKQAFELLLLIWILRTFPIKFNTESKNDA